MTKKTTIRLSPEEYRYLEQFALDKDMNINEAINWILFQRIKKYRKDTFNSFDRDFLKRIITCELNDSTHDLFLVLAKIKKTTSLLSQNLIDRFKYREGELEQLHKSVEKNFNLYYAGLEMESPYWKIAKKYNTNYSAVVDVLLGNFFEDNDDEEY